jgi:hypothetical protein
MVLVERSRGQVLSPTLQVELRNAVKVLYIEYKRKEVLCYTGLLYVIVRPERVSEQHDIPSYQVCICRVRKVKFCRSRTFQVFEVRHFHFPMVTVHPRAVVCDIHICIKHETTYMRLQFTTRVQQLKSQEGTKKNKGFDRSTNIFAPL